MAGSINPTTEGAIASYGHDVVRRVVSNVIELGGGIVIEAGKEPLLTSGQAQVFVWSALETVGAALREGTFPASANAGCPVVVVVSEKAETEIPEARRPLWRALLESGKVEVRRIMAGARSGAMIRQNQVSHGDVLLILGGGTGVEHLAVEYRRACKPVIPLDLPLGASRGDGTGGAERLARESRSAPEEFIRLTGNLAGREGSALAKIATGGGQTSAQSVAVAIIEILLTLAPPTVFYVRLLNREHTAFAAVESFFRGVVDPVVDARGFTRVDLGVDAVRSGFLNVEIFTRLHHATVAVVDVTGERPNCFIELGFALGRGMKVICTAADGTPLPFDQNAIPCHFWNTAQPDDQRRDAFQTFWSQNVDRSPLVT